MKRKTLFHSRFNGLYVVGLTLGSILFWTATHDIVIILKIFGFFILLAFIFTGMQFRFYEDGLVRYYIIPSLGRYCSYKELYSIEFRDIPGPYQTPKIIIHFSAKSEGAYNFVFRSFMVRRKNVGKLKAIAEQKGIRWFEKFE